LTETSEHDDPTRGEATGDEQALEDPTLEPSTGIDERTRAHRSRADVKRQQKPEDRSGATPRDDR
jgi:hypothetical protein